MADTIKLLSDRGTRATIVLVGVADSLADLIEAHESVGRNLAEVYVPLMSEDELRDIVTQGWTDSELEFDATATAKIARLARGYPNYAHLLGVNVGQRSPSRRPATISRIQISVRQSLAC